MKARLYSPPPGYYDMPFTWAFDASIFANGSSPLGSSIYLLGGFGNFFMRRVVGLNRILAADGTGQFQIARKSRNVYLSSDPIQAPNSPELPIAPEEPYLETGRIWFDLYSINLPAAPLTAQLAFQGVRRQAGVALRPAYKNFPKTFTYQVTGTLLNVAPAGPYVTRTSIVDYDFELYNIIIMSTGPGTAAVFNNEEGACLQVSSANGASGTLQLNPGIFFPLPNTPFSLTVSGSTITVILATNAGGGITTTLAQLVSAINTTPAAAALATALAIPPGDAFGLPSLPAIQNWTGGGNPTVLTTPVCSLQVFDSNRVAISNLPILDIFYNGGPGSPYRNGAMVPPLFYPKDSVLEIDFYSQITNPADLPTSVIVYLVGRQIIPC